MRKQYYLNVLGIDVWKPKIQKKFLVILDTPLEINGIKHSDEKTLLQEILRALHHNIDNTPIIDSKNLIDYEPTHILAFNIKNHDVIKNKYSAHYIFTYALKELMQNPIYKKNLYLKLLELS